MYEEIQEEKITVAIEELADKIKDILEVIQKICLRKQRYIEMNIHMLRQTMRNLKILFANKAGFIKAMWCGSRECEDKIKEDTTATSRCMPFEQEKAVRCVCLLW